VWHTLIPENIGKIKGLAAKLCTVQNKYLRTVAGAYRATLMESLKTETYIPPIDLYLDSRVAAFYQWLQSSPSHEAIQKACRTIQRNLRLRGKGARTETTGQQRNKWESRRAQALGQDVPEKQQMIKAWERQWALSPHTRWDQVGQPPQKTVLKLHTNLWKAESSVLVQFRTGRTGLAYFLNKVQVPEFNTAICCCGQAGETPQHLLLYCLEEEGRREELGPRGNRSFPQLIGTLEGARITTRWAIQSGRLRQFNIANSLLYD
jgi:hypothetical protein